MRFAGLLKRDLVVAYRNYFFLIVLVVGLILVAVTNFLIPEKVNMDSKIFYGVEGGETQETQVLDQFLSSQGNGIKVESRDEILSRMKDNKDTIGVLIKAGQGKPSFEIIMRGYENEQSRRTLALTLNAVLNAGETEGASVNRIVLKDPSLYEEIGLDKSSVPLMVLNESIMLGFALLATLIFMEKEEGTTKAFLVTPGRIWEYLLSKLMLMTILGLLSSVLIIVFTVGFRVDWFSILLIVASGCCFSTTLAMVLASFFDNISKAMVWILGVSLFLTAPMVSYFAPSFAPRFITWMPTYRLMFALREALFPTGNFMFIQNTFLSLVILSTALFLLSTVLYKSRLLRE